MTGTKLRLVVMRHGEAVTMIGEGDRSRHLTSLGKQQAESVGKIMKQDGWSPDEALVSSATRTRETFAAVATALGHEPPVRFLDSFYLADWDGVLAEVSRCQGPTVLLIGHNPGWSDLVERLSGKRVALMPSETALLSINVSDWAEAIHCDGDWECVRMIRG